MLARCLDLRLVGGSGADSGTCSSSGAGGGAEASVCTILDRRRVFRGSGTGSSSGAGGGAEASVCAILDRRRAFRKFSTSGSNVEGRGSDPFRLALSCCLCRICAVLSATEGFIGVFIAYVVSWSETAALLLSTAATGKPGGTSGPLNVMLARRGVRTRTSPSCGRLESVSLPDNLLPYLAGRLESVSLTEALLPYFAERLLAPSRTMEAERDRRLVRIASRLLLTPPTTEAEEGVMDLCLLFLLLEELTTLRPTLRSPLVVFVGLAALPSSKNAVREPKTLDFLPFD
jgi:hypothetical protein